MKTEAVTARRVQFREVRYRPESVDDMARAMLAFMRGGESRTPW